jgi:prepilin signal peptidase PulO-like enzyme (type II secretory pathway)
MFLAYYATGDRARFLEMPGSQTIIVFVLHLFLLGGLIAASKIDADLFIIPLGIPWVVTVAAILVVPLAAGLYPNLYAQRFPAPVTGWGGAGVLPRAPLWGVGAAAGGAIGLIIAYILLRRGILPISFLEPAHIVEMEDAKNAKKTDKSSKKNKATQGESHPSLMPSPRGVGVSDTIPIAPTARQTPPSGVDQASKPTSAKSKAIYLLILTTVAIALWVCAGAWGRFAGFVLMWWGVLLVDFGAYGNPADLKDAGPEHWYVHPRPRFETLKEVLYLTLPVLGALIGIAIVLDLSPDSAAAMQRMPVWLRALAGSVLGYLVGCGVVWGVRIMGNLGFGKESMGLGDVHLVGCIGAVIGGNDATVAFLLAAFFGLGYALVESTLGRLLVKRGVQIPYGPHLCGAAVALMLFRDPIQKIAETWMGLSIFSW